MPPGKSRSPSPRELIHRLMASFWFGSPYKSETGAMTTADKGSAVFKWVCGDVGTTIPTKFLTGRCRAAR